MKPPSRLCHLVAFALAGAAAGAALSAPERPVIFSAGFPAAGLVTNEYAYWNPGRGHRSSSWQMDSGSLLARDHSGWTGNPDTCEPGPESTRCTDSAIFRLTTRRANFANVGVSFQLQVRRFVSTSATPAVPWDGIHIWLRYQNQRSLYYASVARRDGSVVIKKKCRGGQENGGTYFDLTPYQGGHDVPLGRWRQVGGAVRTLADGSVALELSVDGRVLVHAHDTGVGCPPITKPGRVGIRGDNADFLFRNFEVRGLA